MPEEIFTLILIVCFAGILLISVYLIAYLLKRHSLSRLYDQNGRDFRFICELLRLYGDKNTIIKNPCLMKNYGSVSPRADAVIVGGGGVLILTVLDEPGQYSTPASGSWSVWQAGEAKRLPNAFLPGRQYISVISGILVKCGLSCPVVNAVVLTDDHATIDSLHEANVMTANDLVAYVNAFCRRRALGRGGQEKLKKAIRQHHEQCQRQLSSSVASNPASIFSNTGEFPKVTEERAEEVRTLETRVPEPREEAVENSAAWDALFAASAETAEEEAVETVDAEAVYEEVFEETVDEAVDEAVGTEALREIDEALLADDLPAEKEEERSAEPSISFDGLFDDEPVQEDSAESNEQVFEALIRSIGGKSGD